MKNQSWYLRNNLAINELPPGRRKALQCYWSEKLTYNFINASERKRKNALSFLTECIQIYQNISLEIPGGLKSHAIFKVHNLCSYSS